MATGIALPIKAKKGTSKPQVTIDLDELQALFDYLKTSYGIETGKGSWSDALRITSALFMAEDQALRRVGANPRVVDGAFHLDDDKVLEIIGWGKAAMAETEAKAKVEATPEAKPEVKAKPKHHK